MDTSPFPPVERTPRELPSRSPSPAGAPRDGAVPRPARPDDVDGLGPMVGRAPVMRELFRRLERLARGDTPVLLAGETGTGKRLAAMTLHALGGRPGAPFLLLLDPDSGPWREPSVPGSTLFVREVGDLSGKAQDALLQLLRQLDRAPRRAGGRRPWRLVCSTGRDLSPEVARGSFRRDLYARLCGAVVAVPALRERRADLPLLAEHFLAEACQRRGRRVSGLYPEALGLLLAHSWEGNVRELRGEIERAIALVGDGEPIGPRHLSPDLAERWLRADSAPTLRQRSRELERRWIARVLAGTGWNVAAAARELGISRVGLSKKIRALDLKRPARRDDRREERPPGS